MDRAFIKTGKLYELFVSIGDIGGHLIKYSQLIQSSVDENSAKIKQLVEIARKAQSTRFDGKGNVSNANMSEAQIKLFRQIDKESHALVDGDGV